MTNLIVFIAGAIVGGGVVYIWMMQHHWIDKGRRMSRIWKVLERTGHITHAEAARVAEVSDTTADRYLAELEQSGQIKQIGKTGKYVYYEKN